MKSKNSSRTESRVTGKFYTKPVAAGDAPKFLAKEAKTVNKPDKAGADDKVTNLKAYRRANSLCFVREKWKGKNHQCPPNVPLHIIQELLEAVQM